MNVVGLMSGTSADGVDAAFITIERDGGRPRVHPISWTTLPFPTDVRNEILAASEPSTGTVDRISRLNFLLGAWFSDAVVAVVGEAGRSLADVDLIASHGQTIYHAVGPDERTPSTLQIGSAAVIAERTGRTVVADFRQRDVAAGGQGAPLTSFVDYLLFGDVQRSRALQNIGGIGNVTFLPAGAPSSSALAFDTGPGNMVVDALVSELFEEPFDRDGKIAASGRVDEAMLAQLLDAHYFALAPPKTTGREQFGAEYAARIRRLGDDRGTSARDLVATATALTARSIADAYRRFLPTVDEVVLSGGGAANGTLVTWLSTALDACGLKVSMRRPEEFGIASDAKEAIVFAVLGFESLHGRVGTLPNCTGAAHPVVLGSIVPGDNFLHLVGRVVNAASAGHKK